MRVMKLSIPIFITVSVAIFLMGKLSLCEEFHGRIPYISSNDLRSIIGQLQIYYGDYKFYSYSKAINSILDWNSSLEKKETEYTQGLEDWNKECEIIKAEAKSKVIKKEYDELYYELVPVYYEDLGVWVFGWKPKTSTKIVEIIPEYKLPDKPKFDNSEYYRALSAYCYLINDGLSPSEWDDLRTVILYISHIQKNDTSPSFDVRKSAENLVNLGYINITKKGNKKYKVEYTEDGLRYFEGLINRCWEFRRDLIESASSNKVINEEEYLLLSDANNEIKEELLKQLEKKKDWNWELGDTFFGTYWSDLWGTYLSKLPNGLLEAFKTYDVKTEDIYSKGDYPYYRVLTNIPLPRETSY